MKEVAKLVSLAIRYLLDVMDEFLSLDDQSPGVVGALECADTLEGISEE